jgi:hypothetical protein
VALPGDSLSNLGLFGGIKIKSTLYCFDKSYLVYSDPRVPVNPNILFLYLLKKQTFDIKFVLMTNEVTFNLCLSYTN